MSLYGASGGSMEAAAVPNAIAFDGDALSVDYAGYLSQHEVVCLAPPTRLMDAMPIGDGDIGGSLWCPGCLRLQVNKSDLWADPPRSSPDAPPGPPENWRLAAAGAVSLHTDSHLLAAPERFEQRLCLHSGTVTIRADSAAGACQITAFAAATAGVLVVRYEEQIVRLTERHIEIRAGRDARPFALGDTAGILHSLRDRRYALLARVEGRETHARLQDRRTAHLDIAPCRSVAFTLYIAVTTSPRDGDPVGAARSRLQAATAKGYDALLRDHTRHWTEFWKKSFLRLTGPEPDPTPNYLENLWYLTLYYLASCSRGYDAPLPWGGFLADGEEARSGPALYDGAALRAMFAALPAANHLELTVPYIETCHRLLPELERRTGRQCRQRGARFPALFNRFGDDFGGAATPQPCAQAALEAEGFKPLITSQTIEAAVTPDILTPTPSEKLLGDSLETPLLIWEAFRYAPDPILLRERVYPLLRAGVEYALEIAAALPEMLEEAETRTKLVTALRALVWASAELDTDAESRAGWEADLRRWERNDLPYHPECLHPFAASAGKTAVDLARDWLAAHAQRAQGLFVREGEAPDLAATARLCAGLSALLLTERSDAAAFRSRDTDFALPSSADADHSKVGPNVLRICSGLPAAWSAAFTLAAPGGFRISAECAGGSVRYVAVKSLLGGVCRLANPWGIAEAVRVLRKQRPILRTSVGVLEFETERDGLYIVERTASPLAGTPRVRLGGHRSDLPKTAGSHTLGLPRVSS